MVKRGASPATQGEQLQAQPISLTLWDGHSCLPHGPVQLWAGSWRPQVSTGLVVVVVTCRKAHDFTLGSQGRQETRVRGDGGHGGGTVIVLAGRGPGQTKPSVC